MNLVTFELQITAGTGWDTTGQRDNMDLVTFGLGITTGTAKGKLKGKLGHAWEATGGNGLGNFRPGNHHWDTLGKQRETMDLVIFGLGITTGTPQDTTGHHGSGNFRARNHHWDRLGHHRIQRDTMDRVTFELGITTGTRWDTTGHNGTPWIW